MKLLNYLFLSLLLVVACSKGDSDGGAGTDPETDPEQGPLGRTFSGNVLLTSQDEIDDFGAKNYVDVTGNVTIDDSNDPGTIVSLAGLNPLIRVQGSLYIQKNDSLRTINGFTDLEEIGAGLIISENTSLEVLSGFENLESIGGDLSITNNDSSFGISGFSKLMQVDQGVYITNLFSPSIEEITAFDNLTTISKDLVLGNIKGNLDAFDNIESLGNDLVLQRIEVQDLGFLDNMESVGGELTITLNGMLQTLNGLQKLSSIGSSFIVLGNPSLASLNGLDGLNSCDNLAISENRVLRDYCGLQNLLSAGWDNEALITANAFNPTVAEISSGGCSE